MRVFILLCVVLFGAPVAAQNWSEPARGTATRSALMDALRPHAEWLLGAPVQFVVRDLRVSGDVAFAAVLVQRPGGKAIELRSTPGFQRGEIEPDFFDGMSIQALYQKSGSTWVAVHWELVTTDVWYSYADYCLDYYDVISDFCG